MLLKYFIVMTSSSTVNKSKKDCLNSTYILKHRRASLKNTVRGGVSRDKYSMRRSRVLYLSRDMSPSAVFFIQTS